MTTIDYKSLFGLQDSCRCEECRSVYGAPAYLVDILNELDSAAQSALFGTAKLPRRPDIGRIFLSCQNTNTPMPYIDLVNEAFENAIVPRADNDPNDPWPQTTWTADQLSANPQYVREAAYVRTGSAIYSWDLPFASAFAEVRAFLTHLGVSRADLMGLFRVGTSTDLDRSDAAIAAEAIGLTPFERSLVGGGLRADAATDAPIDITKAPAGAVGGVNVVAGSVVLVKKQTKDSENGLYLFDGQTPWRSLDLLPLLVSVAGGTGKGLWRARFDENGKFQATQPNPWEFWGLDAQWLSNTELNKTYDPNKQEPAGVALCLKKSGLSYDELVELLTARFINPDLTKPVLTIQFPKDAGCDVDQANFFDVKDNTATAMTAALADRIERFTRLRRKLGWSATDLDKAIFAFQSSDLTDALLVQLAQAREASAGYNLPLVEVLSWWGTIDTAPGAGGAPSLYDSTFRNKTVLALQGADDAFALKDDGSELKDTTHKISDYATAITAGLGISSAELATLVGNDPDVQVPDQLNLANLSFLFRVVSLSRALALTVAEFVSLRKLSGVDPFDPANIADMALFGRLAAKVADSGFTLTQLDYLCRDVYDPASGIAPSMDNVLALVKSLHEGLQKIADDDRAVPDPKGDLTRKKLGILWKAELVQQMIGLLDQTAVYSGDLAVKPTNFDANGVPNTDPNKGPNVATALASRAQWSNGTLSIEGPLSNADINSLIALDAANASYKAALTSIQQQPRDFLTNNAMGFLTFDGTTPADVTNALTNDNNPNKALAVDERFAYVLAKLLPYLQDVQSRALVYQGVTEALKLRPNAAAALLGPGGQLSTRMQAFLDTIKRGLSIEFHNKTDFTDVAVSTVDASETDIDWGSAGPGGGVNAALFAARWRGKLMPAYDESYTFYVNADNGVRLWIGGQKIVDRWNNGGVAEAASTAIQLKAGQLYDIVLDYYHDNVASADATVDLMWCSPSTPKGDVPADRLYPQRVIDAFSDSFRLLEKAAMLVSGLKLSVPEITYLTGHGADFANLDFGKIPLDPSQAKVDFFNQWTRLCDLTKLRDSLPGGAMLTSVFSAAASGSFKDATTALLAVSGWGQQTLNDLINGFNLAAADLKNEIGPAKLLTAIRTVKRLGVAAAPLLFDWAIHQPSPEQARQVKNAAKAKYDDAAWLNVAKPLQDSLRQMRRDALVAYLIANGMTDGGSSVSFADSNELFDYFLIDPEMSSCQQTSRIKQAMGSVQLFVMRSLLNLENDFALKPADAARWTTWMSRYRVWQANRKVFLYPENWIEPELRDDKTPFFKELENDLLQQAVTKDSAEDAFRNYLEKLDEVARLQPVGIYHEIDEKGIDIYHVFGRAPTGQPKAYYYRRLEKVKPTASTYTGSWTPWEKVNVDITGDHLIPVVWNRRLYLFWPVFTDIQTSTEDDPDLPNDAMIQLAWSQYRKGKWTAKSVSSTTDGLVAKNTWHHSKNVSTQWDWGDLEDRSKFVFKAVIQSNQSGSAAGEDLIIRCLRSGMDHGTPDHVMPGTKGYFEGNFIFNGCGSKVVLKDFRFVKAELLVPSTAVINNMVFGEISPDTDLSLYQPNQSEITILPKTPGHFDVLYPHQYPDFDSQDKFFFDDDRHTYIVTPAAGYADLSQFGTVYPGVVVNIPWETPQGIPLPIGPGPWEYGGDGAALPGVMASEVGTPGTMENRGATSLLERFGSGPGAMGLADAIPVLMNLPARNGYDLVWNQWNGGLLGNAVAHWGYLFETFYHPYACQLIRLLNQGGVDELLTWPMQVDPGNSQQPANWAVDYFAAYYSVDAQKNVVDSNYPQDTLDFSNEGATPYSQYNWEIFFHAPLLIAQRLSQNQQFEEARRWFHFIFDPTDRTMFGTDQSQTARFWKMRRFYDDTYAAKPQTLEDLLKQISGEADDPNTDAWKDNPFDPHLIARSRLVAYQKNVVMKYLDNLIAWGDQLFRQETIEAINEATQLYVLASEILGARPKLITDPSPTSDQIAFKDLPQVDPFSNVQVDVENLLLNLPLDGAGVDEAWRVVLSLSKKAPLFCLPQNDKLLGYWDTVADRLFKIRNCMNIEGVVRQLPLFEPPIDPGLLVKAAAAGLDLGSVLNQLNAPLPHYRFATVAQKATELCNEVKSLGGALLAALEKKDAEGLALLRARHEIDLLDLVTQVKQDQINEAARNLEGLQQSRVLATTKQTYYTNLIAKGVSDQEQTHLDLLIASQISQGVQGGLEVAAGIMHLIPDTKVSVDGGPTYGGANIAGGLSSFGSSIGIGAGILTSIGTGTLTSGGYDRRSDEWQLQVDLATAEIAQIDKQILAAQIRKQLAEHEMTNHLKQKDQAAEVLDFMQSKYTNAELYDWMVGQISAVYFQTYQLAYDLAKKAERAYQFELADYDASFIQFGYWDSLNKGLLAGDKLSFDLKRMESAFLDNNKREYEITKHISLAQLDAAALIALKQNGECFFSLPESLFDADFPGHYMRRIKSVSVTVPCVTGPYTGINGTLSLLKNSVRFDSKLLNGKYDRDPKKPDSRFRDSVGTLESIAISTAQNDGGLFEPNLRDERFLPFEGAGVIGDWQLEMDKDLNRFDFESITDVVLHVRYTARPGIPKANVKVSNSGVRLVSLRHEFSDAWYRFLHPADGDALQSLLADLTERFPYQPSGSEPNIDTLDIYMKIAGGIDPVRLQLFDKVDANGKANGSDLLGGSLNVDPALSLYHLGVKKYGNPNPGQWLLRVDCLAANGAIPAVLGNDVTVNNVTYRHFKPDVVEDVVLLFGWTARS